jgi:hypothetical protein
MQGIDRDSVTRTTIRRLWRAVSLLALFVLLSACAADFPGGPAVDDVDFGVGSTMPIDEPSPIDAGQDAFRPPLPDAYIPPSVDRGAPEAPEPPPVRCAVEWPASCLIDCSDEPPPSDLLWVRGGRTHSMGPGQYAYACVVIEGTLFLNEYAAIQADVLVLGGQGRIVGDGSGSALSGDSDGDPGTSTYGRGSGGGGGSGICPGGESTRLTDQTEGARSGQTHDVQIRPGGNGGEGGDWEGFGGIGGRGGASLKISAVVCSVAGMIDLSGEDGTEPMESDGGGGGGGGAGNLALSCRHLSLVGQRILLLLNGGRGGRGGQTSSPGMIHTGGGGGGGASGSLQMQVGTVDVDGVMLARINQLIGALSGSVLQEPGQGGEQGLGGPGSERGRNGSECAFIVRPLNR